MADKKKPSSGTQTKIEPSRNSESISMTLPPSELEQIAKLQGEYIAYMQQKNNNMPVDINRSMILRAGIIALSNLSDTSKQKFFAAIQKVRKVKEGRPQKE